MSRWIRRSVTLTLVAALVGVVHAQYSNNPAVNLAIADSAGEQNQVKIRARADGGCYLSWLDNRTGGYDTYLQRLNAEGVEMWPHNGVLIADTGYSSTEDYGLAVDPSGNAILSYRDDRPGSSQIGVNKVAPDGTLLWGANGVILAGGANGHAPRCAALDDGNVVIGWSTNVSPSTLVLQKLDANGAPQWGAGVAIADPPNPTSRPLLQVSLQPGGGGTVIAQWVRCNGSSCATSAKHIYTQKFDATGAPLWNAGSPLAVFDGSGSVQNGYSPPFVPDGAGGAVYGWYDVNNTRRTLIQHVSSAGIQLYAHNGVAGSLQVSGKLATSPDLAYDEANDAIYMFWTDSNSGQSMWGVYGQKFTAGVRQWGDPGAEFVPLNTNQNSFIRVLNNREGVMVFWFDRSGNAQVVGMAVNAAGATTWTSGTLAVCSTLAGKARLDVARNWCGEALLAWGDARTDVRDIYAQNARPLDGSLGATHRGDVNCDGVIDFFDIDPFLAALFSPTQYQATYCGGSMCAADCNCSGGVDFFDIDSFLECVFNVCPACP